MRSEREIRARRNLFLDALAATYGKDQPFNEERIKARIEEDEWVLNDEEEEKIRLMNIKAAADQRGER